MANLGLENAVAFDADGDKIMYIFDPVFPGELSLFFNKGGQTIKVARVRELTYDNGFLKDRRGNGGPFPEELVDDMQRLCLTAGVRFNAINTTKKNRPGSEFTSSETTSTATSRRRKVRREIVHDLGPPVSPRDPFWKYFTDKMETIAVPRHLQPGYNKSLLKQEEELEYKHKKKKEVHPDDEPPKIDIFETDCFESQVLKKQRHRIEIADRAYRAYHREWKQSRAVFLRTHGRLKRDLQRMRVRIGGTHVTAAMRTLEHNIQSIENNMEALQEPLREHFPPVDENDARPFPLYASDAIL
eukprot:TRINITY_DN24811_c0_g1_i1.p1 TRINITY_DN24811_c0_g1~~TRINITY_DN24811_c0_g1_i1.p1  ORF type:complete len:300 (+),score=46.81 TRINITY_DN24811_c0_g1_i1:59-958(+)